MRKTLIAEYHTSLAEDQTLTAEFFARLKAMMRARRLLYGAREIGVALRPHLLTRNQFGILARPVTPAVQRELSCTGSGTHPCILPGGAFGRGVRLVGGQRRS